MISNGWPRRPNVSRVHDYLLGGKDNYEEDRRFAENLLAVVPDAQAAARANRHFLGRAVRFAAHSRATLCPSGLSRRDQVRARTGTTVNPPCRSRYPPTGS